MCAAPSLSFDERWELEIGPPGRNAWTVSQGKASLVRRRAVPRAVTLPADPVAAEIDLDRTALVVIDMQNDFCDPRGWFPRHKGVDPAPARALFPAIESLTAGAARAAVPVVWVNWGIRADRANLPPGLLYRGRSAPEEIGYGDRTGTRGSGALVAGGWGAQVADGLSVRARDLVVHKHRYSGFQDNELDSILRNLDVTTLLFAGINTDRCVFATLTHATFLGYDAFLVADACATPSASEVVRSTVWLVRHLYGFVAAKSDVLATFESGADED